MPNRKGKKKIVHVNNCKTWHHANASVLRIVVVAEDDSEDEKDKLLLFEDQMTDSKQQTLKGILDSYADVLKDDPGLLKEISHVINTGDSPPLRSVPYRICPAWREDIKNEIATLLNT